MVFCEKQIKHAYQLIQQKRSEENFYKLFKNAKERSEFSGRKYVRMTDEQLSQKYKILYFEILDVILTQITTRFKDIEQLQFCSLVDTSKFPQYSRDFPFNALASLQNTFPGLFKPSRLKTELELLYVDDQYRNVPPIEALKLIRENKEILQETYKLFSLVLTLPSTSVSVERSFSTLNRIKTNLRNSMTQGRLSSLASISTHKDLLHYLMEKQPFHDDITEIFAARKNRRIHLTYKK